MALNNPDIKFYNIEYYSNLLQYFNPRISRVIITMVIY